MQIQEMTDAELGDSISNNFIIQMISHHRAAIKMSQNLLPYTTCVPLQEIASNIIESQNKSITVRMSENALDYCICPELIPILDDIITSLKQGIAKMQHLLRCSRC